MVCKSFGHKEGECVPSRKVVKKWVHKEGHRVNAEAVKTSEASKDATPAA